MDSDQQLELLFKKNPKLKKEWEKDQKLRNDPRVSKIGKIVPSLSLDELPQMFNVLKREMSFVAPSLL